MAKKTMFDKKADLSSRVDLLEDILLKVGNEIDIEVHKLMATDHAAAKKLESAWKEIIDISRRIEEVSDLAGDIVEMIGEVDEGNNKCFDDIDAIIDRLDYNPIVMFGDWIARVLGRLRS